MFNQLNHLSALEMELFQKAEELEGSMEDRLRILDEIEVFSKYRMIHKKYLKCWEKTNQEDIKLEALKRLTFLNWYVNVEPGFYTGLNELDENTIIASYQILEDYISNGKLDQEFQWMLSYYYCWDWVMLQYSEPDLVAVTNFVKSVDASVLHVPTHQLPKGTMDDRGQMGYYWKSCSVEAETDMT